MGKKISHGPGGMHMMHIQILLMHHIQLLVLYPDWGNKCSLILYRADHTYTVLILYRANHNHNAEHGRECDISELLLGLDSKFTTWRISEICSGIWMPRGQLAVGTTGHQQALLHNRHQWAAGNSVQKAQWASLPDKTGCH